jgi:hypothetical protein
VASDGDALRGGSAGGASWDSCSGQWLKDGALDGESKKDTMGQLRWRLMGWLISGSWRSATSRRWRWKQCGDADHSGALTGRRKPGLCLSEKRTRELVAWSAQVGGQLVGAYQERVARW